MNRNMRHKVKQSCELTSCRELKLNSASLLSLLGALSNFYVWQLPYSHLILRKIVSHISRVFDFAIFSEFLGIFRFREY